MKFRSISKGKINQIANTPGVYAFYAGKKILYIGKAANLRERIKTHFNQPSYRDHLFIKQVNRVGYIETQSDIDALLWESQLIKTIQPKYNIMWKDGKNYFYVAISKEPLPRVFITHQPTLIGPFVDGQAIKEVLRILRRAFPYYTAKRHPRKPCQWCHLKLCPGPNPNKTLYQSNLKKLALVLKGKRNSVMQNIEHEMKHASKNQQFEKAAELRNQWFALRRIAAHAPKWQEKAHGASFEKGLQKILHTKKRIARIEAYDISNIQGKEATGSMVTFIGGAPAKQWYRKFKIRFSGKPNDFAMMKELVARRLKHTEWLYPNFMVIDGGKGQLSSALAALGKRRIFVGGLAKQKNELFLPNKKHSVLLETMPAETRNLLMHIRDEAHRFAVSYHRKLRRIDLLGPQ